MADDDAVADEEADDDEEDEELVHAASSATPAMPPAVQPVRNRRRSNWTRSTASPSWPPSPRARMSSVHSARLSASAGMARSWCMASRSAVMPRSSASDRWAAGSLALIYMAPWLAGAALVVG